MKEYALISDGAAGADFTSVEMGLGDLDRFSIQVDFTGGALAGTLWLQASNDNADWVNVTDSDQAITSGASHMWNVQGAAYKFVRVFWDYTSGAGTLSAKAVLKENVFKNQ